METAATAIILQHHWLMMSEVSPVERRMISGGGILLGLWNRLLSAIDKDSPRLLEMLLALLSLSIGTFFSMRGDDTPTTPLFRVMFREAPLWVWVSGAYFCSLLHIISIWIDNPTWRVHACSTSLFCWMWFGRTFAPFGFGFPEAISYPIAFFALVCSAALIRQYRRPPDGQSQ